MTMTMFLFPCVARSLGKAFLDSLCVFFEHILSTNLRCMQHNEDILVTRYVGHWDLGQPPSPQHSLQTYT